jgi:hypothetical protein
MSNDFAIPEFRKGGKSLMKKHDIPVGVVRIVESFVNNQSYQILQYCIL